MATTSLSAVRVSPSGFGKSEWAIERGAGHARWHERLYTRLQGQAYPLTIFEDGIVPAASLWSGARRWVAAFRENGLETGDRLVIALPASPAFIQVLIAGIWEGLTLAFLPPADDIGNAMTQLDARAGVALKRDVTAVWTPELCCGPVEGRLPLRAALGPPTPDARFLLRTSGTTGMPHWVALSDDNLFAVLDSHRLRLRLEKARLLSVLPWHHAFGLVIELLSALLAGAEIVCDPSHGRDPNHIAQLAREHASTHLFCVPLTIQKIAQLPDGESLLRGLGGVIGGAPVSALLADLLAETRFQVGYGQTEASPGIALGEPGLWMPSTLGRSVGCRVRLSADSVLEFSGMNACLGLWTERGLERLDADRWVRTGDLAAQRGQDFVFLGRADDCFKLSNGRAIEAGRWEGRLRDAFPELQDALLYTPDGDTLAVGLLLDATATQPGQEALRAAMCMLGSRLTAVGALRRESCRFTPKGELDRAATRRLLQTVEEQTPGCVST